MTHRKALLAALFIGSALPLPALADPVADPRPLDEQFRDPPATARPRVWWHWMNGNITKDGIAKDLAWMKAVGIGGAQTFDANLQTPQVVAKRLAYMSPEWKDAFRFAASEADRLGLELAIASSPGWSETGGPWVKPADAMKKLVWSEVAIAPGTRLATPLPALPDRAGPFQDLRPALSIEEMITGHAAPDGPRAHGEVAVLAWPEAADAVPVPQSAVDGSGTAIDPALLASGAGATLTGKPPQLEVRYAQSLTVTSATLHLPGELVPFAGALHDAVLEAADATGTWHKIADIALAQVPTTVSFAPVSAARFRVVLSPHPMHPPLGAPAPGVASDGLFGAIGQAIASRPVVIGRFSLSAVPRVDHFETKAGFVISPDYHALPTIGDDARGAAPGQVQDLTALTKPDGTLDWTAPALPAGQVWHVARLGWSLLGTTNHPATPEATGLEVDKYDGTAVAAYLDHYLGMYRDAAGPGLIGAHGVRALLTDSIEVGEANWTPRVREQFQRLRGYDPLPWFPALTGALIGSRAETDRFLFDWRRTLADLLASEHYGTIARVAHAQGLTVYGEALEDHRPMLGDDMTMRSHTDVPMAALWTYARDEGPRQTLIADMKGAASVAHLYGQNLVAAESMTASMAPWAFAPKDLKRFIDLEFATGVNRPVIHTSVHVPVDDKKPGLSLFIFGQYFNRMESWAGLARPWVDYIARSALLLQRGRNVADVAYFHGEEAPLTSLYGDHPVADAPVTHAYDFLSFDALTGLLSNDGAEVVSPAGARYRAIQLGGSSRMMTLPALRKLAALVEGGALLVGEAPVADPSLGAGNPEFAALVARLWPGSGDARIGKGRVIAGKPIEAALAMAKIAPDFAFAGGSAGAKIPFVHRRDGDAEIWFVNNRQDAAEHIEAHFRIAGKAPELWHAETGKSEPASYRIEQGETIVPLDLQPEDAVFVVFRKAAKADRLTIAGAATGVIKTLDSGWSVRFEPGHGAPATLALPRLVPLNTSADPGVKYFSGVMTYSRNLTLPARPKGPLWLDLGAVGDLAQVSVNGIDLGTAWHAPWRIDIARAARKGANRLDIRVANTWVNRLIGDAQPGARPITWTAMPTYRADAPLRPAGLIGPVRLLRGGPGE